MAVSVTLGLMLYAFVRQSEKFSKKDRLLWIVFVLVVLEGECCLCVPNSVRF